MTPNPAANEYLKTKVMTASPTELRMMLFDGAIKFCHQAREAIAAEQIESAHDALMRAQKIVLELSTSLDHKVAPDICDKLTALYIYIYKLLVDANMHQSPGPIDEALKLLDFERETWRMVMDKSSGDAAGGSPDEALNVAGAQQTAINSLSVNG